MLLGGVRPSVLSRTVLVALALAVAAAAARAEPADPVAAETLFEQARAAMAHGAYAEACPKLEESQRLAPALGTAFNLADCWAHVGRLASAWSLFRDVEGEAQLAHQTARGQVARRRADELEPRLPRMLIRVPSPTNQIEVRRDGIAVGPVQWGTAVPVDLGAHVVAATAPGHKPWRDTVRLHAEAQSVTVVVPPLEIEPPRQPTPAFAPPPPPAPPRLATDVDKAPPAAPPSHTAAIVAGIGGLALLAASGVTAGIAFARYDSAGPCSGSVCFTSAAVAQRNQARTLGNVATGLAIGGGVALAAGAALWLIGGHSAAHTGEARTAWAVGITTAGLVVRETW
jgi:hypothetical protein